MPFIARCVVHFNDNVSFENITDQLCPKGVFSRSEIVALDLVKVCNILEDVVLVVVRFTFLAK